MIFLHNKINYALGQRSVRWLRRRRGRHSFAGAEQQKGRSSSSKTQAKAQRCSPNERTSAASSDAGRTETLNNKSFHHAHGLFASDVCFDSAARFDAPKTTSRRGGGAGFHQTSRHWDPLIAGPNCSYTFETNKQKCSSIKTTTEGFSYKVRITV